MMHSPAALSPAFASPALSPAAWHDGPSLARRGAWHPSAPLSDAARFAPEPVRQAHPLPDPGAPAAPGVERANRRAYVYAAAGLGAAAAGGVAGYQLLASLGPTPWLGLMAYWGLSMLAARLAASPTPPGPTQTGAWLLAQACRGTVLGCLAAGALIGAPQSLLGAAALSAAAVGLLLARRGTPPPLAGAAEGMPAQEASALQPSAARTDAPIWLGIAALSGFGGSSGLLLGLSYFIANVWAGHGAASGRTAWTVLAGMAAAGGLAGTVAIYVQAPLIGLLAALGIVHQAPREQQFVHASAQARANPLAGANLLVQRSVEVFALGSAVGVAYGLGRAR